MKWNPILLAFLIWAGVSIGAAHELDPGDMFILPFRNTIETDRYSISLDFIPDWEIDQDIRKFLPKLQHGLDYSAYTLRNKDTGFQRTTLIEVEGGKEPWFKGVETGKYCSVKVILFFVQRDTPRYGGSLSRWLTTYIFRADTFEMLEEFDGTPYDVTRFDSRWVPEVDSIMDERYLVSCFPAGRGRVFSFGLLDRERLYGPDWCGPGRARCRVDAPTP